jgi:2-polyprenyl-3-methyl-5-hydroxy-6-metoxy-1,4-benzoquinol methylase
MLRCNICQSTCESPEQASVPSNVRKFKDETFCVWRCPACLSLHARDEVDLGHYYASYPFHNLGEQRDTDGLLQAMYRNQLRRLRAAGLRPEHKLLDYGCGGGAFVKFLRAAGYQNVSGFDEYSDTFGDRAVLEARYDVILTQDVLEHVAEPWDFLHTISGLLAPSGVVMIGTPNAEALDLQNIPTSVHALHQPYHRHILSKQQLLGLGDKLGWELLKYYPSMYSNTLLPFVNQRYLLHYFRAGDNTLDIVTEPVRISNPKLYTPSSFFWGFFGYFFPPETDVAVVYRKTPAAGAP